MNSNEQGPDLRHEILPGGAMNPQSVNIAETRDPASPPVGPNTSMPVQKTRTETITPYRAAFNRFKRDKRAIVSVGVLFFFVLLAIFGPLIYLHIGSPIQSDLAGTISPTEYHQYYHQELSRQDQDPSAVYWLGTDPYGRDLLSRLMQGVLISILVSLLVEVVDVTLGILIGVLAGYYGGWIDQFLARFTDVVFAFPPLMFAILLIGIFGSSSNSAFANLPILGENGNARLVLASIALAFVAWPLMARYVRAQTLQLKEQQYVEAARTSGTSAVRIIMRHIVPNLMSLVIIAGTLDIANTIVNEAGLSLLGLGVTEPGSSLGLMIADALGTTDTHPIEVLVPTLALAAIVLAISFIGDGLRDALDPNTTN